jgi:serine phosphatase RsbU (regulator of sigma subunit)
MQSSGSSFEITLEQIPRPGLWLCQSLLAATWLGLLLYDITVTGYRSITPADYGLFRSLLPLVALLPSFIRLLKPTSIEDDHQAYAAFRTLTLALAIVAGAILLLGFIPYSYSDTGIADSFSSFIIGRFIALAGLLGVPLLAEYLLRLYNYNAAGPAPRLATWYTYGLILIVVLSQLLPLSGDENLDLPDVVKFLGGVLGFLAVLLSVRVSWIIYLSKQQKLSLLGLSVLGVTAGGIMMVALEDLEAGQAFMSLFPGLPAFTFAVAVPILVTQITVFLKSLVSLPTATAIDRRNMEVSSLANFARLLTQSFDIEDLIDTAIAVTCDVTGGSAAWIEIVRDNSSDMLYGASPRLPSRIARQLMETRVSNGTTLAQTARQRARVEVANTRQVAWPNGNGELKHAQSVAAAPLRLGSEMIGMIYVAKEKSYGFNREDMSILSAVADQIALAIEQSRLIRTSIEREKFEQEMLIARDVQQRLLPKLMPESPFYEVFAESQPASIVGGDYFDVISFSDQTIGILIADVSGKGASAALYMGMVKGIIQTLSGTCATPEELLRKANVALYGIVDQRWFVTMTCAQIIEPERRLRIVRAGHCPTLVVQKGEGSYSKPKGIGLAIAKPALFDRNLEMEEKCFVAGDVAVFFSDGLPEATSPDGEELGYDQLREIVVTAATKAHGATEMRDAIFEGISTFTQGELPDDDSTLVIIRWR